MIIYVGDARDVVNRILTNHCSGNVEGSALRKSVAGAQGYGIRRERRPSGTVKLRIALVDPRLGERAVSQYTRSGKWRYLICRDWDEAHDFQGYVIQQLAPRLNSDRPSWDASKGQHHAELLARLLSQEPLACAVLRGLPTGAGVCILEHSSAPSKAAA